MSNFTVTTIFRYIVLFLPGLIFSASLYSQSCLPDGLLIYSQEVADNFHTNYPGCNEIEGDVIVYGTYVKNLHGLSGLTSIGGSLIIGQYNFAHGSGLSDLQGLESLTSIGGRLAVLDCDSLVSLTGLESLESIGGDLYIEDNPLLASFAFNSLQSIGGPITVHENNALVNMSSLSNLHSVGGNILFMGNDALLNFNGFQGLTQTDYGIIIGDYNGYVVSDGNESLQNMEGFNNLRHVGGNIIIENNPVLYNLEGLNSLQTIDSTLWVYECPELVNLDGLEQLTEVNTLWLRFLHKLQNVHGLSSLTTVSQMFTLSFCTELVNLSGLENLETAGKAFSIYGCDKLENVDALQNVRNIVFDEDYGGIHIAENSSLTNLNGLSNIESIVNYITIENNDQLKYLDGFDKVPHISRELLIRHNPELESITGFGQLNSVGAEMELTECYSLADCSGLQNLTAIGESLEISYLSNFNGFAGLQSVEGGVILHNNWVQHISSMNNLNYIGGSFTIRDNRILESLDGFAGLQTIKGSFTILRNDSLKITTGIEGLTNLQGRLIVGSNDNLKSLEGLENIDANQLTGIAITGNNSLSYCEIKSVCDYIGLPDAQVQISNSGADCADVDILLQKCSVTSPDSCLVNGIIFDSQAVIDEFLADYPDCQVIQGDVEINGIELTDLSFLNNMESIVGDLIIANNPNLESLHGLDHLTSVAGSLYVGLDSKGGNPSLTNLTALSNLILVDGQIQIGNNLSLVSLEGLQHINEQYVDGVVIVNNPSLTSCAIDNFCNYLDVTPEGMEISNNAPGCSSEAELAAACSSGLPDADWINGVDLYPNPTSDQLYVRTPHGLRIEEVWIYSLRGEILLHEKYPAIPMALSDMHPGMYFLKLSMANTTLVRPLFIK